MDNVAFTSKINFVDIETFYNRAKGAEIKFSQRDVSMQKAREFYTCSIRTCTAGGLIDTKNAEAVGFHYFDSEVNSRNVKSYVDRLFTNLKNPDRCLLLGGKTLDNSRNSMEIFNKFKEILSERIENISIFQEHVLPWSESNLHYFLPEDTWNIYSMYRPLLDWREYSILSEDKLYKNFKDVKIAEGDILNFKC